MGHKRISSQQEMQYSNKFQKQKRQRKMATNRRKNSLKNVTNVVRLGAHIMTTKRIERNWRSQRKQRRLRRC